LQQVTGSRRTSRRSSSAKGTAAASSRPAPSALLRSFWRGAGKQAEKGPRRTGIALPLAKRGAARAPRPGSFWAQVRDGTLPVWPAAVACAAFYLMVGIYGAALGGHMRSVGEGVGTLVSMTGLAVRSVEVEGVEELGRLEQVRDVLGVDPGDPILWLDTHAARQRVEALAWVKSATVLRLLPNALRVSVEPREAFAIWQRAGRFAVIDKSGAVIAETIEDRFASLPLVVGYGANTAADEFLAVLAQRPELRSRMRAAVRVADRRWNLRLINGIDVRLPEEGYLEALDEVEALDQAYGLLARDIAAVDLRVADRITIRLSDEAAMRRAAALRGEPPHRRRTGEDT
jgi:cell division protein FtsQ